MKPNSFFKHAHKGCRKTCFCIKQLEMALENKRHFNTDAVLNYCAMQKNKKQLGNAIEGSFPWPLPKTVGSFWTFTQLFGREACSSLLTPLFVDQTTVGIISRLLITFFMQASSVNPSNLESEKLCTIFMNKQVLVLEHYTYPKFKQMQSTPNQMQTGSINYYHPCCGETHCWQKQSMERHTADRNKVW